MERRRPIRSFKSVHSFKVKESRYLWVVNIYYLALVIDKAYFSVEPYFSYSVFVEVIYIVVLRFSHFLALLVDEAPLVVEFD